MDVSFAQERNQILASSEAEVKFCYRKGDHQASPQAEPLTARTLLHFMEKGLDIHALSLEDKRLSVHMRHFSHCSNVLHLPHKSPWSEDLTLPVCYNAGRRRLTVFQ